jgi:hypothetical protein
VETTGPACALCSKPFVSGSLIRFEHGEFVHVYCRTRVLEAAAMDQVARADALQERAARLVAEIAHQRRVRRREACPLCGEPAAMPDSRPNIPWIAVDGCGCGGFLVWTALLDARVPRLTGDEREALSSRIRILRKRGVEAWLATRDGTPGGEIVIRDERPDDV